ncbi:hypothetical protein [Lysobacter capsici]|uniref:hypothetical protein n=1 Tax=Lysobacter capsici TaxID=435897 RepID=UPI00128FFDEE|nr:hypothetical protein [Lysobacter capsici]
MTRRFSGGTLLILLAALKASKLQSSRAFEVKGKINSFRPQAAELLSFVKSDKRKVTKEKRFFVNQGPARSVQTRARATRDILVPVARDAHPCASPFGCAFVLARQRLRSAG